MSVHKSASPPYPLTRSVCKPSKGNTMKSRPQSSCGPNTSDYLSSLPQEILANITQHLPDLAILVLRHTCRKLHSVFLDRQTSIIDHREIQSQQKLAHSCVPILFPSPHSRSVVEQLAFLELLERDDPSRLTCSTCITRHQRSSFASDAAEIPVKKRICIRQIRDYELELMGFESRNPLQF
jgi:F-box domain